MYWGTPMAPCPCATAARGIASDGGGCAAAACRCITAACCCCCAAAACRCIAAECCCIATEWGGRHRDRSSASTAACNWAALGSFRTVAKCCRSTDRCCMADSGRDAAGGGWGAPFKGDAGGSPTAGVRTTPDPCRGAGRGAPDAGTDGSGATAWGWPPPGWGWGTRTEAADAGGRAHPVDAGGACDAGAGAPTAGARVTAVDVLGAMAAFRVAVASKKDAGRSPT